MFFYTRSHPFYMFRAFQQHTDKTLTTQRTPKTYTRLYDTFSCKGPRDNVAVVGGENRDAKINTAARLLSKFFFYCWTAAVGGCAYWQAYCIGAEYWPYVWPWPNDWQAHGFMEPGRPRLWKNLLLRIDCMPSVVGGAVCIMYWAGIWYTDPPYCCC